MSCTPTRQHRRPETWWEQQGYNHHPTWGGAAILVLAALMLACAEFSLWQSGDISAKLLFVSCLLSGIGLSAVLAPLVLTRAPAFFQSEEGPASTEPLGFGEFVRKVALGLIGVAWVFLVYEAYLQFRLGCSMTPSLTGKPAIQYKKADDTRR